MKFPVKPVYVWVWKLGSLLVQNNLTVCPIFFKYNFVTKLKPSLKTEAKKKNFELINILKVNDAKIVKFDITKKLYE